MPVFPLIAQAWTFSRKHPVFQAVLLWMSIVPLTLIDLFGTVVPPANPRLDAAVQIALLVLESVVATWALAAFLLVGRRMLENRPGRARTSLKAVARESAPLVLPLLLTSLLRACILLEWAVLLVLPALVYGIRTTLYPVVLALEGLTYRDALRRSTELTRGRFWSVTGTLLLLTLVLIVPAELASLALSLIAERFSPAAEAVAVLMGYALSGEAGLLFTLSLVALYGRLRTQQAADAAVALRDGL